MSASAATTSRVVVGASDDGMVGAGGAARVLRWLPDGLQAPTIKAASTITTELLGRTPEDRTRSGGRWRTDSVAGFAGWRFQPAITPVPVPTSDRRRPGGP